MIFNVSRRSHLTTQLSDIKRSSHFIQVSPGTELFCHSQNINRLLANGQIGNGCINQLMTMFIERLRAKYFTHQGISILFNHQCTQHRLLEFRSLRLQMSIFVHRLSLCRFGDTRCSFRLCHSLSSFLWGTKIIF